ncbi:MAG: hypothetical protein ABSB79_03915 [Syntrophales bacterium]
MQMIQIIFPHASQKLLKISAIISLIISCIFSVVAIHLLVNTGEGQPMQYKQIGALIIMVICMIGFALGMRLFLSDKKIISNTITKDERIIASDELQNTLEGWLSHSGYTFTQKIDPEYDFYMVVTVPSREKDIGIGRLKTHPQNISIESRIIICAEYQERIKKLSLTQLRNIRIEIDRLRLDYYKINLPNDILLIKRVPITSSLTEDTFIKSITELEVGVDLVMNTMLRDINK